MNRKGGTKKDIDRESRFVEVSKSKADQVGLKREELIGKTDFDYFTEEHAIPAYEDEQKIIKTGKPVLDKIEKETHSDGRITWVSTTKIPRYEEKGKIIGVLGISRDITGRKELEDKLKLETRELGEEVVLKSNLLNALMEHIPDRIYFLAVSESKAEGTGLAREEFKGKTDFDFFPEEEAKVMREDEVKIMKTGEPVVDKLQKIELPVLGILDSDRASRISEALLPRIVSCNYRYIGYKRGRGSFDSDRSSSEICRS